MLWDSPQGSGRYPCSSGAESEHMFQGEFSQTIDDKGRLHAAVSSAASFPQGWSSRAASTIACAYTPKTNGRDVWQHHQAALCRGRCAQLYAVYVLRRQRTRAGQTGGGGALLPTYLRLYAHLGEEAVIVGAGERLEVWNPTNWQKVMRDMEEHPGGRCQGHGRDSANL